MGTVSGLVLDLFPGLELLGRAFREHGFCVVSGPDKLWGDDVRDFHPPAGRFDGVIGGSPCQSFSALANLVRAKGLEPRFGNLIPEFERVVREARPAWFLHENVPAAPIPRPRGYDVSDFLLCNSSIPGEDGLGQEQERVRRFTFGVRAEFGDPESAPNLLRWIPRAALRLPACQRSGSVAAEPVNNPPEAKGRVRTSAVVADARETRVAIGGSGKPKARVRQPGVSYDDGPGTRDRVRVNAVAADPGSEKGKPGSNWGNGRRTLAEMLRLQGLPEDLLEDLPLTAKAARKLVANGVPMPMGRAVARAVVEALRELAP